VGYLQLKHRIQHLTSGEAQICGDNSSTGDTVDEHKQKAKYAVGSLCLLAG
jgi:hypothetical protein